MISKIKYFFFRQLGAHYGRAYLRATAALTTGMNESERGKIIQAEKICPMIVSYRVRAKNFAILAREAARS